MKKIILGLSLASIALTSCKNEAKETVETSEAIVVETTKTPADETYEVNVNNSTIAWEGFEGIKLLASEHNGTINLSAGKLFVKDEKVVGGKFNIDMNSIIVLDIPADNSKNAKLTNHLKDPDFFDTPKFPEANFEIISIEAANTDSSIVNGNLTIKGISKNISFAALIVKDANTIKANAKFYINRKDWGINYRSEDSLGDKMIRPEMGIAINLIAQK